MTPIALWIIWSISAANLRATSPSIRGQHPRIVEIDWSDCQSAIDALKKQVGDFNSSHKDGPQLQIDCLYAGHSGRKPAPEKHIALTAGEIIELHRLRATADADRAAENEYEKHLLRKHRVRQPSIEEVCFYFVGIKVNEDFITIDPNPMMPNCEGPVTDLWVGGKPK